MRKGLTAGRDRSGAGAAPPNAPCWSRTSAPLNPINRSPPQPTAVACTGEPVPPCLPTLMLFPANKFRDWPSETSRWKVPSLAQSAANGGGLGERGVAWSLVD